MRLIHYFLKDLPEDAVLNPKHRHLLEAYLFRQKRLDRFIGNTDLAKFMTHVPRYHRGSA